MLKNIVVFTDHRIGVFDLLSDPSKLGHYSLEFRLKPCQLIPIGISLFLAPANSD